jgi:hypothetical protein
MPPLHFANGVCQGGAWKASGLDVHQHPIEVKHEAPLHPHFGWRKKFPDGGLGKKLPSNKKSNKAVVWSATSSYNERTSCTRAKRRAIEVTIKRRMV